MKDIGATTKIQGMKIRRDKKAGKLWLLQKKYTSNVLEKFNMQSAKRVSALLTNYFSLSVRKSPIIDEEIEKNIQNTVC